MERLALALPDYTVVDEPYHLLQEEGYEFNDPPSLDDFEVQLERSIAELSIQRQDVIFDRCPLDFLAYMEALEGAEAFDVDTWLPQVRQTLDTLDLIVFLPIEDDDRIAPLDEDDEDSDELRGEVDGRLWELFLDDPYGLGPNYIEVEGDVEARAQAVLRAIQVAQLA